MAELIDVKNLTAYMRTFCGARAWTQFHSSKNLSLALAGEVGELCAELQWLTEEEASADGMTPEKKAATAAELADVAIYLVQLADCLQIDLDTAVREKMAKNEIRFPIQDQPAS